MTIARSFLFLWWHVLKCIKMAGIDSAVGLAGATGSSGALGPIGMGVGMAAQIFGMVKSAKERKKQQNLLNQQQAENKALYDKNANQSFLDTSVAKSGVTAAKEDLIDANKEVAGRGAITGASDEANIASSTAVTKNYNRRLSELAGMGTQYQQNQEGMYRNTKSNLDNQQTNLNKESADSAGNLVENGAALMGSSAMMIGGAKKPKVGSVADGHSVAADLTNFNKNQKFTD